MGKKMYYTEEEAMELLGIERDRLSELVSEKKLRLFKDGQRTMFRADDLEKLAEETPDQEPAKQEEEIELSPADTSSGSSISLADADEPIAEGKDDTVITAEGISVFDEDELDTDAADPMAKTQISMSMEDQANLEGATTGSGLLDLTREGDDTSLGEVLDHIDTEGSRLPLGEELLPEPQMVGGQGQVAAPRIVEEVDPTAGLFGGLATGAAVIMLVLGSIAMAEMVGVVPGYLEVLSKNVLIVLGAAVVIMGLAGGVGFYLGKSSAQGAQKQA